MVAAGGKGGLGVGWRVLRAGGAHVAWAGWGQEGRRGVAGGGGLLVVCAAWPLCMTVCCARPLRLRSRRVMLGRVMGPLEVI